MICVETMTVCPKTVTLKLGSWYYGARAVVFPDNADCTDVEWCSDKENVVAVNESSGYIYAKNPGTARVYAHTKDGSNIYDYITVTVQEKIYVSSIELCPTSISVAKDDCVQLSATVLPENATRRSLNWTTSNPSIAAVYEGKVCGINEGTATITAIATDDSGKSATCQVTVTGAVLVESITVYPATKTLEYGNGDFLHATVCPENAVNKTVEWSSRDPNIVIVSPTEGIVYGKDAGTTTVYATATDGSGVQGSSEVTVNPFVAVECVKISSENEVMNVGDTLQLTACVCPENATNKSIRWSSSNEEVATVDYYTGEISANDVGTAVITATTIDGGFSNCSTVTVRSTDPFHHSNVEYVRIKKWKSIRTHLGITYTECDMSTAVTKSYINNITYFTVFFPNENQITTFEINGELLISLNSLENEYEAQWVKNGKAKWFHLGKEYADGFVSEGKIEYASPEYYGIWAYNGNSLCEIYDRLSFAFALATTAYSGFMYGFTKIMSLQSMQMTAGQIKTYTNSQYMDVVESQKAIADISDDVAVQLGKTDIISSSTARRTWRASEMRVAENYPMSSGFEYNRSYKIVDGKLTQVPHGTAGSQRPDFYNPSTNQIIEVKNYTVTTQAGRNSLANNIATQYNNRKTMFPNVYIEFKVDVYGQSYTQSMLDDIVELVTTLTEEDIVRFIYD